MPTSVLAQICALSAILGFGSYCLGSAFHVWRSRNPWHLPQRLSRLTRSVRAAMIVASACLGIGLLAMITPVVTNTFSERIGDLHMEDVDVVRAPPDLTPSRLAETSTVELGEVLAQFHSPQREADLAVLKLRRETLTLEANMLAELPLEPNPQTIRQEQALTQERRHLHFKLNQLLLERRRLEREAIRQRAETADERNELAVTLMRLQGEIDETKAQGRLWTQRLDGTRALLNRGVVSKDEHAATASEVASVNARLHSLSGTLGSAEDRRTAVEQDHRASEALFRDQLLALDIDIAEVREQLEETHRATVDLQRRTTSELRGAEHVRDQRLDTIQMQIQEHDFRITGLQTTLVAHATLSGDIVYRNPAPSSANTNDPLIVVAPPGAVRCHIRLPASAVRSLSHEESITLELEEQAVQRRFSASFLASQDLPHDSSYVEVVLSCTPPQEAVREMVLGMPVRARLLWKPPITSAPIFQLGLVLLFVATGALGILARMAIQRARRAPMSHTPRDRPERPSSLGAIAGTPLKQ